MPKRKHTSGARTSRTRRNVRRRTVRTTRKRYTGPMARRPRTYKFSRETWADIDLAAMAVPANMPLVEYQYLNNPSGTVANTQLNINFMVNLNTLPENSEFINLFDRYRITGFSVQLIPQVNTNVAGASTPNLICDMIQNTACGTIAPVSPVPPASPGKFANLNQDKLAQIVRKRQFMWGATNKPKQFYVRTRQSSMISAPVAAGGGTDYTVSYPKFISTDEPAAYHGGMLLAIRTADDSMITSPGLTDAYKYKLRLRTYIECRYVK